MARRLRSPTSSTSCRSNTPSAASRTSATLPRLASPRTNHRQLPADQPMCIGPRPSPDGYAEAATASDIAEIDRMQEILYAQSKHALLVVLQGLDTSGKDGTVRKVFSSINPLGAVAVAFKKPTPH